MVTQVGAQRVLTVTETSTEQTESEPERTPQFDDLPLTDEVRRALDDMGYAEPTPVQISVYEPMAAGRDVVVQARTGTGKTCAFGLPLVDNIVKAEERCAQALVLCPTRELALQVARELERLAKYKNLSVTSIYGGAAMSPQVKALQDGAQIIAGTPGRVLDHLKRGTMDPSNIRALVLDESDEMLSMGFERELAAILDHLPERRQTLLFSATLPPDILRMAKTRLHEPAFVTLSGDHIGALEVQHLFYRTRATLDKPSVLLQVLEAEDPESAIVFCNTKEKTELVAKRLEREGYRAAWLNGDLAQKDRERVMRLTREGEIRFLVATDVAARGIDISHVTHVINYDFPQDAEAYIHRTGRTGRAGRTGTAIALVEPQDVGGVYLLRLTYKIRPIERQLPSSREAQTRREADIIESLVASFAHLGTQDEHQALARRLMSHTKAEAILAGLLSQHFVAESGFEEKATDRRRGRVAPPAPQAEPKPKAKAKAKPRREPRPEPAPEPAPEPRPEPAPEPNVNDGEPREDDAPPDADAVPPKRRRRRRTKRTTGPENAVVEPTKGESSTSSDPSPDHQEPAAAADTPLSDGVELHLNAGRRHGAAPRKLKDILAQAEIDSERLGRMRVRESYSFVEIPQDMVDAALDAFNGATLGEHDLVATLSQRQKKA